MKFKGGHFAIGAPLAEFKGGPVPRCPPRSAAYARIDLFRHILTPPGRVKEKKIAI